MTGGERWAVLLDGRMPSAESVGGKGAALARLVAAGVPVPPTAVVTTEAYRRFAADRGVAALIDRIRGGTVVDDADVDGAFAQAPIDARLEAAIVAQAVRSAGGHPIAVRSSATVEDLATSSFAGQYRSLLDVDSGDASALIGAVRLVWASLWHAAPCAYRRALSVADDAAAMAVVLMEMVPARSAGVVFTVDPGGEPGSARVEAVAGLGESLVSGAETPEAWVLPRRGPFGDDVPVEVVRALDLSLDVERLADRPQDVEWAWDGRQLWVVQARPITTHGPAGDGFDTPVDDHELTTAGIGEMLPGVLPALRWQANSLILEEGFRRLLDDLDAGRGSSQASPPLIRRVRGRAALDFQQLRAVAEALPGGAVDELETQYFGTGPSSTDRRRRHGLRGSLHDLRVVAARRRAVEDSAIVVAAVRHLVGARPDPGPLADDELLRYRRRLLDLAGRGAAAEVAVAAAGAAAYRRLETLLERHLGAAEAGRQAQLATAGAGAAVPADVDASAAVFGGPTWRELERQPVVVRGEPGRRESARRALEQLLTSTPRWRTTRILTGQVVDVRIHVVRRAIADAVELLRRREETKRAVMALGGETRRVLFELAGRLVVSGALDAPTDVELLTERELAGAVAGSPPAPSEIVRRRLALRRYEQMGPLPLRFVGSPGADAGPLPPGRRLDGWAASPGRHTGRARVLGDPSGAIEPGEVLVAAATDASWSPIFVDAGAIVVERGGPLSHAAILARELGVPAVLNVTGATRSLDGRIVTVDGDTGTVVVDAGGADGGTDGEGFDGDTTP